MAIQEIGLCSQCQRVHPVVPRSDLGEIETDELVIGIFPLLPSEYLRKQTLFVRVNATREKEGQHVMAPHMMFGDSGPLCGGKGTIPETMNIA